MQGSGGGVCLVIQHPPPHQHLPGGRHHCDGQPPRLPGSRRWPLPEVRGGPCRRGTPRCCQGGRGPQHGTHRCCQVTTRCTERSAVEVRVAGLGLRWIFGNPAVARRGELLPADETALVEP